jgi:hypothetical protein
MGTYRGKIKVKRRSLEKIKIDFEKKSITSQTETIDFEKLRLEQWWWIKK